MLSDDLYAGGWRTPDTYQNNPFEPFPEGPGVYIFLRVRILERRKLDENVAYVGKATNIARRQRSHEVYAELPRSTDPLTTYQRWFKSLPQDEITAAEISLIKKYNPPFNLIHRLKGFA